MSHLSWLSHLQAKYSDIKGHLQLTRSGRTISPVPVVVLNSDSHHSTARGIGLLPVTPRDIYTSGFSRQISSQWRKPAPRYFSRWMMKYR